MIIDFQEEILILLFINPIHSSIHSFFKRQLNLTDDYSISRLHTFDVSYNTMKDTSGLTKTQIKVIITVVLIISFIMLIIALFRFKNACRTQETDHLQTDIIRNRAAQYSEPSSRRGSVGYYTQKYNRTSNIRFDDQLNLSLPSKRLSIPACDPSSKLTAVIVLSSSPGEDPTDVTHHVTSCCDRSNNPNQQTTIDIKPVIEVAINQLSSPTLRKLCLPCITARNHHRHSKKPVQHRIESTIPVPSFQQRFELAPRTYETTAVHSSDYSRGNNANNIHKQEQQFSPIQIFKEEKNDDDETLRVQIESQLTSEEIRGESVLTNEDDAIVCDDQTPLLISEFPSTTKDSSIHTTRKYSLNALLPLIRPSVSHPLCSSLTSTIAGGIDVGNSNGVDLKSPRHRRVSLSSVLRRTSFTKQSETFSSIIDSTKAPPPPPPPSGPPPDSDSSERTSSLARKQAPSHRKKSSSITPTGATTSLSSYPKEFMHKIERFRFIDDSASSTTTVTSPMESIEPVHTYQTCSHLISSAIEQFDDYLRTKYSTDDDDDDVNSLIDCLNSDLLTNGSYSDLNILNHQSTSRHRRSFQSTNPPPPPRPTAPINIPHSVTSLPLSRQRNPIEMNGHSRSMDFQSIARQKASTLSSSSSTATLTSIRSGSSLEFDDNSKPSGVLVDDDFLPMSSPVDEHFWDMPVKNNYRLNQSNGCFPNVGSSPDLEIKYFDLQQLNTLSETSCDEDEEIAPKAFRDIPSIHSTTALKQQSGDDDTQESSSEGNESADNGEIDLVQEFELSQKEQQQQMKSTDLWSIDERDVFIIQDDDLISEHEVTSTINNRSQPTSIMKIPNPKTPEHFDEQQQLLLRPKVRFNLDPQYEREREWNKVNKLLGNNVEWTDEFEV